VPVAVADPPLPQERLITSVPLNARIDRELIKIPPIQPDEDNLVAGAQIYADQCAACHGLPAKPSSFGAHMFPDAPPLWQKHHNSNVVGVSDDPPGETYWKVANGIRLSGMPSFNKVLTDTQMWQVSLLMANADKPLPPRRAGHARWPADSCYGACRGRTGNKIVEPGYGFSAYAVGPKG
jgi:mono/diheme cytochrome c family protein